MHDFDSLETGSGPVEPLDEQADLEGASGPGVLVDALPPNARIIVTTRNSCYRLLVIDGADRRVSITGGTMFPEATEMLLEGATADVGIIKPGWIRTGLRLALSLGSKRITTSLVESVAFERVPAAVHAA
jgi:hypothetical protein